MIRVSFDLSELHRKTDALEQALPLAALGALGKQAAEAKARIVSGAYFKNHTGRTAAGFRIQHEGGLHVSLSSNDLVALYLDGGTVPHTIEARKGGALSFYWAKMGQDFLGRRVNHPGTEAKNITAGEVTEGTKYLPAKLESAAEQTIARVGLG